MVGLDGERGLGPRADASCEDSQPGRLQPGTLVGRYRILDELGRGGIGVVYAAFDDDLNRTIALKLVRASERGRPGKIERRRARLVREAQALARLSHPNVVPIYEVGRFHDQVYLAMEYVEGATLRGWQQRTRPSYAELIEAFVQAGRGLAAAHRADIIHRDFKPANVLVGVDGRVRVLDFGLATPVPDTLASASQSIVTASIHQPERLGESAAALVTAHGKVIGTPAYMAPEQARGDSIDARADQYSFCVALWEALFGERPEAPLPAGPRLLARLRRPKVGRERPGHDVPIRVLRALERGLSPIPRQRFPSMEALLEVLAPRSTGRNRGPWIAAGLAGIVALAVLSEAERPAGPLEAPSERCPRGPDQLAGAWDLQLRERVHARVSASPRAHVAARWESVERELDRWATRWLDTRADSCEATHLHHEQSLATYERREACFVAQRERLETLTHSLAAPREQADPLAGALEAVLRLPDPAACSPDRLDTPPPDAEALEAQQRELARVRNLLALGEVEAGLARVEAFLGAPELPRSQPAPQLRAHAHLLRGQLLLGLERTEEALAELRHAVFEAQSRGEDAVVAPAALELAAVFAERGSLEQSADWLALARASLAHSGRDRALEDRLRGLEARLGKSETASYGR